MTPRRIVVAGWLVFLLFCFPGFMTTESINQLMDARVAAHTDWYAPSMSAIWRLVSHVMSGPSGMLLLQSGLFIAGTYALLRRGLPDRQAAIAAAAILCFPPVAVALAVIWRDAQLTGFLVAGAAAMLSDRRAVRLGGVALVLLGATMRDAAIVAALPLVLLCFRWSDDDGRWRRVGIATAAWIAIVLGTVVADRWLPDNDSGRRELALAQHDVVGVIRFAESTSDAALEKELAHAGLGGVMPPDLHRAVRVTYHFDDRYVEVLPLPEPNDARGRAALLRARKELAWAHFGAYLKHRGLQLRVMLGLARPKDLRPVYTSFLERPEHRYIAHHRATHSWVQSQLIGAAEHTPAFLYRPFLYAFLALVLVPLAIVRRQRMAGALLASGLLYELSLGVVVVAPEYRHSNWMTVCALIATVMLVAQELRRRRETAAAVSLAA